jgi:hypothetical protein
MCLILRHDCPIQLTKMDLEVDHGTTPRHKIFELSSTRCVVPLDVVDPTNGLVGGGQHNC